MAGQQHQPHRAAQRDLLAGHDPTLAELDGLGKISATKMLALISGPDRFRDESAPFTA